MLCNLNLGNLSEVESLISRATDVKQLVNTKADNGLFLLHIAAFHGRF